MSPGGRGRGLRPWDDGRDQCSARGTRRSHRADRHQGLLRPARDRPPGPSRALPALHTEAETAGRARDAIRGERASRPRRRRRAAGRGGASAPGRAGPRERRRVGRRSACSSPTSTPPTSGGSPSTSAASSRASTSPPRTRCCRGSASTSAARRPRSTPTSPPSSAATSRSACRGRRGGGAPGAAGDAVLRRRRRGRRGGPGRRLERPLGTGRGCGRGGADRPRQRRRQRDRPRHGRHLLRRLRRRGRRGAAHRLAARSDGRVIQLPMVDVHTVGAGGGSIGWRDAGGALRVGPRSAGADPGPACYGRGGTEPTVTDANLLLGVLAAGLDPGRRGRARRQCRGQGGRGVGHTRSASGNWRPQRESSASPTRRWSGRSGSSPSSAASTLAASPCCRSAAPGRCTRRRSPAELGIGRILCPRAGGVLSALGLCASDRRRDTTPHGDAERRPT